MTKRRVLGERIRLEGQRADGSLFPVELTVTRVEVPGPPQFTGFIRDITEQEHAERLVLEAEARYRALVETTPVVSYTYASGHPSVCRYISPQIEPLTGYTPEEWTSEPGIWERLLHPEDREDQMALDAARDASGEPYSSERVVSEPTADEMSPPVTRTPLAPSDTEAWFIRTLPISAATSR